MTMSNAVPAGHRASLGGALLAASWTAIAGAGAMAQDNLPNACSVDGCEVPIAEVAKAGDELAVTLDANFMPDVSRKLFHVWWGEKYTVEQEIGQASCRARVGQYVKNTVVG